MEESTRLLLILCSGVVAVLVLASLTGGWLARRRGPDDALVFNLNQRVRAWWVMSACLALAFLAGKPGVILLFALASAMALREFLAVIGSGSPQPDAAPLGAAFAGLDRLACFLVILPVQYALVWIDWYGLFSIFIPVYAFLFLPVLALGRGRVSGYLAHLAEMQWGLMIAVFSISHVAALMLLDIPGYEGRGTLLIAFLIITVQASDVLQYIFGKLWGRHKLAPVLSPSKTWEGLIGGGLSAVALGTALWWLTPFAPWQAGLFAALIVVLGALGGLVLSAIKRDRGAKDWGHIVAGHGGVLDRLDSVVFAAPVFFHLTRYGWSLT